MEIFDYTKIVEFNITNHCNAKCPLCPRFVNGTENVKVPLIHLSKNVIIDTFKNHKNILFCGDFGDPLMHPDIEEIFKASYDLGVILLIHTNGGLRNNDFFYRVATLYPNVMITFCIDGLKDTNHIYRKNVDFDLAFSNLLTFAKYSEKKVKELKKRNIRYFQPKEFKQFSRDDVLCMLNDGKCRWKFICFTYNYKQIDEVFAYCQKHNIKFIGRINKRDYNKNFKYTIKDKKLIQEINEKFLEWRLMQNSIMNL